MFPVNNMQIPTRRVPFCPASPNSPISSTNTTETASPGAAAELPKFVPTETRASVHRGRPKMEIGLPQVDLPSALQSNDHARIVAALRGPNVNINQQDQHGKTALMFAAENGNAAAIGALLQFKATVNLKDLQGHTALSWAAQSGQAEAVKILLRSGA